MSKAARTGRNPETAYAVIHGNSTVVDADEQLSRQTGILHAEVRRTINDFGLADAYVLATSRRLGAKVLTGDPHFTNIPDATMIYTPSIRRPPPPKNPEKTPQTGKRAKIRRNATTAEDAP